MNALDARDWFQDAGTRLKLLSGFFKNIDEFKEKNHDLEKEEYFLIMDEPRGGLKGQHNANFRDNQRFGFWILAYSDVNDYSKEDIIYDQAKTAGFKVLSKAIKERQEQDGLFKFIDADTIDYVKSGPEMDQWFGAYFFFYVSDNANAMIAYDENDWEPLQ